MSVLTWLGIGMRIVLWASGIQALITKWQTLRQGRQQQQTADVKVENKMLSDELDASVKAPTTIQETAEKLKKDEF